METRLETPKKLKSTEFPRWREDTKKIWKEKTNFFRCLKNYWKNVKKTITVTDLHTLIGFMQMWVVF